MTRDTSKPDVPAPATSALDVVTTDPSPLDRRKRRRMMLQGVVITFLLISSWIAVMVGLQKLSGETYNFRQETQLILEQMRDGKSHLVYDQASPRLHETMIEDRFLDETSDVNQTLGGFRQILGIKRLGHISGPGGKTSRVKATIEFDNAKTSGVFSYHLHDGAWRLLGFNIYVPDELKDDVWSRSETRASRMEARKEVHDLAQKILELGRDGRSGEIWDAASPTFKQSVARQTFLDLEAKRLRLLGKYRRILDTMKSARNRSRLRASLAKVVQYERDKATVTFGFIKLDDEWKLTRYKVEIPRPRIPSRLPAISE